MTGSRLLKIVALVAALVAPAGVAMAQTGAAAPVVIAPEQAAPQGPEALVLQERRGQRPPPLGADMFAGEPPEASTDMVDPGYVLQPGDTVQVTTWGMVEGAHDLVIDTQGNVVVPGVGPIRLAGVTAAEAPVVVERASRRVYNEGVQVYATPVSTASTRVLVTGPVEQPGAYPGASDDALIVYLQRAGGIDAGRGSYRRVRVLRGGEVIGRADLYDFLREGMLPRISFRNGDAVVVEEQGPIVSVTGDVRAAFTFELAGQTGQGAEIMQFARPQPGATHVAVVGVRDRQPISAYLTLDEFAAFTLMDGDRVQFESDARSGNVLVRVEGAHDGPSVFTEARGTTVADVLAQVPIDYDADMEAIHLRRQSVREAQRQTLNEGLERLERTVLLSPARSPAEAQSRATSLAFVTEYIERASRRVYNEGVQVYATPVSTASTRVLVTGPVEQPGAYPGASDDALIVYLQRAGGIDAGRGSYRRVRVLRGGEVIGRADLYDFLREGMLPRISFRNGDAVVVEEQGPIVSVTGDVRAAFTFELAGQTGQGAEIMQFARPQPGATHVAVVGVRDRQPISAYLTLDEFAAFTLMDGDRVQFESDARSGNVLVRVEGAHDGPSVFTEARGTTVADVLARVPIDYDADMEAIHLRRQSVREAQRQTLNEGLERLERTVLLSPARSPAEAQSRATSLAFVTEYIERARQVEPLGILALSGLDLSQVRLETGDVIVIPRRSQVVTIAGEVNAPQSLLAQSAEPVSDYVRAAGGFTSRADRRNILVFRQDGQLRQGGRAYPGDRVLVMSKPDSTLLPFLRDLTQTIFQMAGVLVAVDRFSE